MRRYVRIVLFDVGLAVMADFAFAAGTWSPCPYIDGGSIQKPVNGGSYVAGSGIEFQATRASDKDTWSLDPNNPVDDDMKPNWPAWFFDGRGKFENNDNFGTTVKYHAPNSEQYNIAIQAYDDDKPIPVPPEQNTRDDTPPKLLGTRYINAVVPIFNEMNYAGHSVDDIPNPEIIAGTRNEAGVFVRSEAVQGTAKFTDVLCVETEDAVPVAESSDENKIGTLTGTPCTFGSGTGSIFSFMTSNVNVGNSVDEITFDLPFRYTCPDGSGEPVTLHNGDAGTIGQCRVFVLYATPGALKYKKGVAAAVRWALGSDEEADVADGLCTNIGAKTYYNPDTETKTEGEEDHDGTIDYMLSMIPNYGAVTVVNGPYNCRDHVRLMAALCSYNGVSASSIYLAGGIDTALFQYWMKGEDPEEDPDDWVSIGVFRDQVDDAPEDPHFKWHALCELADESKYDPSYGVAGAPGTYCYNPYDGPDPGDEPDGGPMFYGYEDVENVENPQEGEEPDHYNCDHTRP